MIRRLLFALFLITLCIGLNAQNDSWRLLTYEDGLPSSKINDVILVDSVSYYLATDSGLYVQSGTSIFTFNTSNSNIASNNILELVVAKGDLWLLTDSGLSMYDGRGISNYDESNGLLSNRINDITIDTNENLWIASNAGVSTFDGIQFEHDTGRVARSIEIDDSNRVYITKYTLIFNIPSAGLDPIEMYDGQQWVTPSLGSFVDTYRSQFYKTPEGKILLLPTGGGKQFYGELVAPFEIKRRDIYTRASSNRTSSYINEFADNRWIGYQAASSIYKTLSKDSVYSPQYLSKKPCRIADMSQFGDHLAIATDQGLFLGPTRTDDPKVRQRLDVNQIGAAMNALGSLFGDAEALKADFEYPIGSGKYLFRNVDFQYGMIRDTANPEIEMFNLEIFTQNYDFGPRHNTNRRLGDKYVMKIDKQTIDQHIQNFNQPNYTPPQDILDWPAISDSTLTSNTNLAPFIDLNNNNCYEPLLGDYPAIEGDQAIYWINHPIENAPLEFHWMLYAYNDPIDTFLNRTVFLNLRVINRDTSKIDYLKFGLQVNADLGNPNDDFNGSDSSRNTIYFYNGDTFDETLIGIQGYQQNPPAIGVTLLNERLESGTFFLTKIGANPEETVWNQIHGLDGNGSRFLNPFGRQFTKFQYSGDPYFGVGWTESNLSPTNPLGNNPGDRRGTMGVKAFSLNPGEMKSLDFAFSVAQGTFRIGQAEYLPLLRTHIDLVQQFFNRKLPRTLAYSWYYDCGLATSIEEDVEFESESSLKVYPNPSEGQLKIENSSTIERIEVWAMSGVKVLDEAPQSASFNLQLPNLNNGIYLLRVFDGKNWVQEKVVVRK